MRGWEDWHQRIRLDAAAGRARAFGRSLAQDGSGDLGSARRRLHFTFSKIMAWVAFDRAIKSAEAFNLEGPIDRWRQQCRKIHDDVCRHGFDLELGSFVRSYGSENLTPAFISADGRIFTANGSACARHSRDDRAPASLDGLVMRYDTTECDDGLSSHEGVFLACSFWLVDAYLLLGRMADARRLFEAS